MRIGYARLARLEKLKFSQADALRSAGCERVCEDHGVSAVAVAKPGLERAIAEARPGDTIVVCSLDRLARTLPHLFALIGELQAAGLGFASLADEIDTDGAPITFYRLVRAFEHFEHAAARDRRLSIEASSIVGRKSSISDAQWVAIKAALSKPAATIAGAAAAHEVTRQAIYSRLAQEVTDASFAAFQLERAAGGERAEIIERLGLFGPALDYRESRAIAAQVCAAA